MKKLKSNNVFAKSLTICFGVLLLITLIKMFYEISYNDDVIYHHSIRETYNVLIIIKGLFFFITSVFFIIWFYNAYKNLDTIGTPLLYTKGWAIGSWFIPIMSLFIPKKIMDEIWINTQIAGERVEFKSNNLVTIWWGAFICNNLFPIFMRFQKYNSFNVAMTYEQISNVLGIVSIVVTVMLVRQVSEFESAMYEKFEYETSNVSEDNFDYSDNAFNK